MKDKPTYNPYTDKTLHSVKAALNENNTMDRTPFNDVLRHYDIVQGIQTPKRIDQFPRWFQNPLRIVAAISVLIFASFMVFQVIRIIRSIASGT